MTQPARDGQTGDEKQLEQLRALAREQGFSPSEGGLLDGLLRLDAFFLDEVARRLERVPEKHRLAMLNLARLPRRGPHPAETAAVFHLAEGCEQAVNIPAGTLLWGEDDVGGQVEFRTKWSFSALPGRLADCLWCDAARDRVGGGMPPLTVWDDLPPDPGAHRLELLFDRALIGAGQLWLSGDLSLEGRALPLPLLAEPERFLWDLRPPGATAPLIPLTAAWSEQERALALSAEQPPPDGTLVLCLTLRDRSLTGLLLRGLCVWSRGEALPPEAVAAGGRLLEPDGLYPFGKSLRADTECFVFCGEALGRPGCEVTLTFDLTLETVEEALPEIPRTLDYRLVMRRPPELPEPAVSELWAEGARWEYWNGAAFCPLYPKRGRLPELTEAGRRLRLVFDRPDDLARGDCGAREGFFLRLSWDREQAVPLPRRLHVPRLFNLRFAFCYPLPVPPTAVWQINFDERRRCHDPGTLCPFPLAPLGRALALRLEGLPETGGRLQLFVDLGERWRPSPGPVTALLWGRLDRPLLVEDGTEGLCHSGILAVTLPEGLSREPLLGRAGCWLCLLPPYASEPIEIAGIHLNGQQVANRRRHERRVTRSELPRDGLLALETGNVVKAWVYVREPDAWRLWKECEPGDGPLPDGGFTLDRLDGRLAFPRELAVRGAGAAAADDVVTVLYDTSDGARGNLAAGRLNRLVGEIPFVAGVSQPAASCTGWDVESDARLARRTEHWLYGGQKAVTARDWELLLEDACPVVREARCLPGSPPKVFVFMEPGTFPELYKHLCGELLRAGGGVTLERAVLVPLRCRVVLRGDGASLWDRVAAARLPEVLARYLDPYRGGPEGRGWRMGQFPRHAELVELVRRAAPRMRLVCLEAAARDGRLGELDSLEPQPWHLPGGAEVKLEVLEHDETSLFG